MPQAADGPAVDPTPTGLLTFLAVAKARMSSTESGAVLAKDNAAAQEPTASRACRDLLVRNRAVTNRASASMSGEMGA